MITMEELEAQIREFTDRYERACSERSEALGAIRALSSLLRKYGKPERTQEGA